MGMRYVLKQYKKEIASVLSDEEAGDGWETIDHDSTGEERVGSMIISIAMNMKMIK